MLSDILVVCPQCGKVNRAGREKLAGGSRPDCGACGAPLFPGVIEARDDAAFQQHVARSSLPIVVDFWAAWCGPCKAMAPQFAAAARQLDASARFIKVDTEKLRETAARFSIRSIPTLVMISEGKEIARQAGATNANAIVHWAQSHMQRA